MLRTFARVGPVLALHVRGRVIETTWEHPFFALERGWTEVGLLQVGEWIRLRDGWARVEGVADTGRIEVVYNLEVEDCHTYFVTGEDWGWAAWAHNAKCSIVAMKNGKFKLVNQTTGKAIGTYASANKAAQAAFTKHHTLAGKFRKPSYAPTVKKWLAETGRSITVSNKGVWTYKNAAGVSVRYVGGHPQFPKKFVRQTVDVKGMKGTNADFTLADKAAKAAKAQGKGSGAKLATNTWHHHPNGKQMVEVDFLIHKEFTHIGGASKLRKKL